MIPIEKAILYTIGTGNYYASDIFEIANKELKKMGSSTRHYSEFKKKFYEFSKSLQKEKVWLSLAKEEGHFATGCLNGARLPLLKSLRFLLTGR